MFDMIVRWYQQRFSDPHTVTLLAILLFGFLALYFFGHLVAPLLVAIVLAYLLEWPVKQCLKMGIPRTVAVIIVLVLFISLVVVAFFGLVPTIWQQVVNLVNDVPTMYKELQYAIAHLPERYPELANLEIIESVADNAKDQVLTVGENVVKNSVSSLVSIVTLSIYLILVPLLIFFLLKDKDKILKAVKSLIPKNRKLAKQVWLEMNVQISNYINGKVIEIVIVGVVTYIGFWVCDLRYAVLLAVAVGLSVLIPYIGAALVTIPVAIVGLFQWGLTPDFYWMLIVYGVIQILDGNLLVPLLFSEAVNLHPIAIIIAVLVFGGMWGFWGVFFAIPLATLVKAVWHALPKLDSTINE